MCLLIGFSAVRITLIYRKFKRFPRAGRRKRPRGRKKGRIGLERPAVIVILSLATINLIAFNAAFSDKRRAIKGRRRIRERTLFLLAVLGGSVGLYAGMLLFRHKTKHLSFMLGVPLIFICEAAAAYFLLR